MRGPDLADVEKHWPVEEYDIEEDVHVGHGNAGCQSRSVGGPEEVLLHGSQDDQSAHADEEASGKDVSSAELVDKCHADEWGYHWDHSPPSEKEESVEWAVAQG